MTLDRYAEETLAALRAAGTHRSLRVIEGSQGSRMSVDGKDVAIFAGSNYLDLASHPDVIAASVRATQKFGCAAGGSRLIQGNLALHETFETELAEFFETEAALVFNTGYMANLGVITALSAPGDVIVSDALNHASIVDACRLARAETRVFPHSDCDALEAILKEVASPERKVLLVIDGIYSMDGDLAPLDRMTELAKRHGALVILDDAHGTGTLGVQGRGSAEFFGVEEHIDVRIGTLGKSLGSFGAFVTGSAALRELLINTARSFIFSCALAPGCVAAASAALQLLRKEPWRREQLQKNAARLQGRLDDFGLSTKPSASHILPLVVGENEPTMELCGRLLERGFFAQGIRHPSVPPGSARLRLTAMTSHRADEIDAFAEAIAAEWPAS